MSDQVARCPRCDRELTKEHLVKRDYPPTSMQGPAVDWSCGFCDFSISVWVQVMQAFERAAQGR